jgi:SHS2 domain-containing protein
MYTLSGTRLREGPRAPYTLEVQSHDPEGLLVNFLSELLWVGEREGLGFDAYDLHLEGQRLVARLAGAPILSIDKEIKAVTYHRLKIDTTEDGMKVRVVFDV